MVTGGAAAGGTAVSAGRRRLRVASGRSHFSSSLARQQRGAEVRLQGEEGKQEAPFVLLESVARY